MNEKRLLELIQQESQVSEKISDLTTKTAIQLRKDETRRKILLSSCLLNQFDYDHWRDLLDEYLTTDRDRRLFGLREKKDE